MSFFKAVDRSATKNEIRDWLLYIGEENGSPISEAKADKLANKFKKGLFDPLLQKFLQYADTTGEMACGFIHNPYKKVAA